MKKWLLVALNAKYSHTSLSVRSISAYVKKHGFSNLSFIELTINDGYFSILEKIINEAPDYVGFSVYIWNIELVKRLISDIKSINPKIKIFSGGPEVSYNKNVFKEIPQLDFIIRGEGEIPVLKLLKGEENIPGVCYGDDDYTFAEIEDMDNIPFVYEEELEALKNRAVYYETSRGCPFKCAFCISSLTKGVRTLPLDRVFKEIDRFSEAGIKRVKLVDRTFNFDKKRAKEILKRLKCDNETLDFVSEMVYHHDVKIALTEKSVKRFLNKTSPSFLRELLKLKRADSSAHSKEYRDCEDYIKSVLDILSKIEEEKQCFTLKNLEVSGKDLIEIDIKPGKIMGKILDDLLDAVIEEKVENNKEELINFVQKNFLNNAK